MRTVTHREAAAIAVIALIALGPTAVGAGTAPTTAPGSGDGPAMLTDVEATTAGGADRVVFSFAGDVLPEVQVAFKDPPLLAISGEPVPVAGEAVLQVRMSPASEVDFGQRCVERIPGVTAGPGEATVAVFWSCEAATPSAWPVVPGERAVPAGDDATLLGEAIEVLLGGPNADERAPGVRSPFSPATAGVPVSTTITPAGLAVVDLDPSLAAILTDASTAAASEQVLRELDATVFQFDSVTAAEYRLGGSCDAFFGWLQRSCEQRTPTDADRALYAETYLGPDRLGGPDRAVTEVVAVSDFEGVLIWAIGVDDGASVEVSTLTGPARVVIDVSPATGVTTAPPAGAVPVRPALTG